MFTEEDIVRAFQKWYSNLEEFGYEQEWDEVSPESQAEYLISLLKVDVN